MNVDAVTKRAYLSLEDGDFAKANELLDQVLNEDPENAVVYVGLLCAELKVNKDSELANCKVPIANYNNFKKAIRFGDDALVTRLNNYNTVIINNLALEEKKREYSSAKALLAVINKNPEVTPEQCMQKAAALSDISKKFHALGDYEDAIKIAEKCEKEINDIKALSEQLAKETIELKIKKESKKRKFMKIAVVAVTLIAIMSISTIMISSYYDSLPDKYYDAYTDAFIHGEFDDSQEYYSKYAKYTIKDKDDRASAIEEYYDLCEKSKSTIEALELVKAGDYAKANELFDSSKAELLLLPAIMAREKLSEVLNEIAPIQLESSGNTLYWVNEDGTVGRIGGDSKVDSWTDIKNIKMVGNDGIVFGLKNNGTLINTYSNEFNMYNITSFDLTTYGEHSEKIIIAAVNTDKRIEFCSTDDDISKQSGLDEARRYGNVNRAIFLPNKRIGARIQDTNRTDKIEFKELNNAPCLYVSMTGQNGGIKKVSPSYMYYIKYPDEALLIINSLKNGWDIVARELTEYNNIPYYEDASAPTIEKEAVSIDTAQMEAEIQSRLLPTEQIGLTFKYYGVLDFKLDIYDNWVLNDETN